MTYLSWPNSAFQGSTRRNLLHLPQNRWENYLVGAISFYVTTPTRNYSDHRNLVGGWTTHLNNISQIGSFPQVGVKINNIWNHHLAIHLEANLKIQFPLASLNIHFFWSNINDPWPCIKQKVTDLDPNIIWGVRQFSESTIRQHFFRFKGLECPKWSPRPHLKSNVGGRWTFDVLDAPKRTCKFVKTYGMQKTLVCVDMLLLVESAMSLLRINRLIMVKMCVTYVSDFSVKQEPSAKQIVF